MLFFCPDKITKVTKLYGKRMPSLSQTQTRLPENYVRVDGPPPRPPISPASTNPSLEPGFPRNMRCPVPPTSFTPDSSKQFYRGGLIPQFRAFAPSPLSNALTSQTGSTTTSSSTSSTTTNISTGLTIKSASVTTPVLNPGAYYFATVSLSKAWVLQSVSMSGAARARIYATQAAQTSDALRPDSMALNFETTSGIFCDVTLDFPPFTWIMTPTPNGANGDFPQTANAYVTVNNVAQTSSAITVAFQYVALTT
jgi:hypothetical protein